MTWTAAALPALGVLLAEPVSRMLAGARWPASDPIGALLLWQAIGLAGAGVTYGLAPLGDSLPTALGTAFRLAALALLAKGRERCGSL